jgi:hypothetical protein
MRLPIAATLLLASDPAARAEGPGPGAAIRGADRSFLRGGETRTAEVVLEERR